jgi:anti-sigma factor RsiW
LATKNRHREARADLVYTCKKATSLIADYLTGTLDPEITNELEHHLGVCPDCVAFLKTYKKTIQVTQSLLLSGNLPELECSKQKALHKSIASHNERS